MFQRLSRSAPVMVLCFCFFNILFSKKRFKYGSSIPPHHVANKRKKPSTQMLPKRISSQLLNSLICQKCLYSPMTNIYIINAIIPMPKANDKGNQKYNISNINQIKTDDSRRYFLFFHYFENVK